jgi:serine/threonine protein kinase/tetratricopeptide (TPR) repeat protein
MAPADRARYLDQACGSDAQLRAQVELLLAAYPKVERFLEDPVLRGLVQRSAALRLPQAQAQESTLSTPATADAPSLSERPGTAIGPYKLLEQIGEGGFGVVFMAEQTQPLRRLVALKVLKPGMDTRQVVARFEAERQALALMDHPHIARVLDGGVTASGRPFFVMELVKGVPITTFCDQNRLSVRARLDLFVHVCQAVQHSHHKGVIHRDIKPSNVLVTLHDGVPVVKVIDFGIAKASGVQLTEKTLFTHFAQMIGTPLYMSPEQAQLSGLDVDTRSDIYSLGVLLYELLTGTTPFDKERLRTAGYDELRRIIREEEPPRPSTRLSTIGQVASTVSVNRGSDPKRLSQLVRGELDWIVMKCLEKERGRRYETAAGLALDVQRYLADEPVQACPPRVSYRLKKFVRRNKRPVLAASVFVVLLVGGIVGTTVGLVRAVSERNQKDQALRDVVDERNEKVKALRQAVDERNEKAKALRQAVDERNEKVAALDRAVQARRHTQQALNTLTDEALEDLLGRQVQLTDKHRDFLKKVVAQHAAFAATKADDAEGRQSQVEGIMRVAQILHRLGEFKDAEAAYHDFLALSERLTADFPTRPDFRRYLASSHHGLANLLRDTGRPREAETAYHKTAALLQELAKDFPEHPEFRQQLAHCHVNLGVLLFDTHRLPEAESAFDRARTVLAQLVAEFPGQAEYRGALAECYNELGLVLKETQRPEKAERAFHVALDLQKQLTVEFPNRPDFRQDLATTFNNLGVLLRVQMRYAEAESAYSEALAVRKQVAADFPNRPDILERLAQSYNTMANLFRFTKRPREAEESFQDALAVFKRLATDFSKRPDYRRQLAECYLNLGSFLRETHRPQDAEAAFGKALTLWEQLAKDFSPQLDFRKELARTHLDLGNLWRNANRPQEAEAAYRKALVIQQELADEFKRPDLRAELAQIHIRLGVVQEARSLQEAETEWRAALAIHEQLAAEFPQNADYQNDLAGSLVNLAALHMERREYAAAVTLLEKAQPHHHAALKANAKDPSYRQFYHNNLANLARSYDALAAHARLATTAEELAHVAYNPPTDLYDAAAYLCHCVTFARKDNQLDQAKRKELANNYADRALALLQQAIERGYKDAARFPSQPEYRLELARGYVQVGVVLNEIHRPKDAEAVYGDARAIMEQLVAEFPKVPAYHNDLAATLVNLANLRVQRAEFDAAVVLLEKAQPHHQAALKAKPKDPTFRNFYRNNLWNLAECRLGLGDHVRLAAVADELARFGFDPANDTYNAASYLSRCVMLASKDTQLDEARRKELAQSYANQALALLQQAVERGYKNVARMKQDPNLEPLRARAEFKALLAKLEEMVKK